ncbi:unnamed protein product [Effrenium voratum]|uniref:Uncharacterized protein n=1 Tax=Effrenium voratum TaxID=2562239 RepID=A0AA36IIR9_9DINO|nr:unnamed protein product [Effrenium voratum]
MHGCCLNILYSSIAALLSGLGVCSAQWGDDCKSNGSEDWPYVHRQLLRLLDGQGASLLMAELDRATQSMTERIHDPHLNVDCPPGRVSLDLLLLTQGSFSGVWREGGLLDYNWHSLPWLDLVRSGWPVFRLLRLLQTQAQERAEADELPGCQQDAFASSLVSHVRHHQLQEEAVLGASVSFLMHQRAGCSLSVAAAYLASAWVRFPVYDEETEDLLQLSERLVRHLSLARILVTHHALLDMLDDVASSYQAFLIDSGAMYIDLRQQLEEEKGAIDYTRHMMAVTLHDMEDSQGCKLGARTPLGRCNRFSALGTALSPWKHTGVSREDTARALRATEDDSVLNALHFRLVEHPQSELQLLAPNPDKVLVAELVDCLANIFVPLAAVLAGVPRLEFVVALGGAPRLPRAGTWTDVPPPLFSFCNGDAGYWDIPLPEGLCQRWNPCINTTEASKVRPLSDEEQRCYVFRLLSQYSELLRYNPQDHASEAKAVVKAWHLQVDSLLEDSLPHCAQRASSLIDVAAS